MLTLRISRCVSAAALLAMAGQPALAQIPRTGSTPIDAVSIQREAHGVGLEQGVVRGDGADYKATFQDGGLQFTPAFGSGAPRNTPLRFALQTIRRGEHAVYESSAAPEVAARVAGDRVVYDRDGSITESYEVRADGVELSYTFDAPLPGRGELIVRGRVETQLRADRTGESADGLHFTSAFGGVAIGSVVGIDARGRRAAGSLRYDGQHLDLVLPAAFVDNAVYPLVLDPLIGTEVSVSNTADDSDPDVAYSADDDTYAVVWNRSFSAIDQEVFARRVLSDGTPVGSVISVSPSGVALDPCVAHIPGTQQFAVVFQHSASIFGPFDILVRGFDVYGAITSATVLVANTPADEIEPDVGGGTNGEVIVTWNQVNSGIMARRIRFLRGVLSLPAPAVPISSNADSRPAISKSSAGSNVHAIAWQREWPSIGPSMCVVAVDDTLNLLGSPFCTAGPAERTSPDVDGDGTDFMVVFEYAEASGSDLDIGARLVRYDAARGSLGSSVPEHLVASDSGDDERAPAVAFLGPKFLVVWADEAGVLAYEIAGRAFDPRTCAPCGNEFALAGTQAYNTAPAIASEVAATSTSDEALIVFASISQLPPFAGEVRAQQFAAFGGGQVTNAGGDCGSGGGAAAANGPAAIGNKRFAIDLAGSSTGAPFASLSVGFFRPPVRCGSCRITLPVLSVPVAMTSGNASLRVPLPCDPGLVGGSVEFQWLQITTQTTTCLLLPGLVASNRLVVTVDL